MSLVDPGAAALVRAFRRRTPRRPPAAAGAARDPMFRRSGTSFDLKNIRDYLPADDPRRIDWKLEARTGRLYVKEYYDEERDGVALLVDLSLSLEAYGGLESLRVGATLAWILGALGLPLSIHAFGRRTLRRLDRPRGGLSTAPVEAFFGAFAEDSARDGKAEAALLAARISGDRSAMEALRDIEEARRGTDIGAALREARRSSRHRRAVVVSDFFDPGWKPGPGPFSRNFYLRLHRPFPELAREGGELDVQDPESGARIRLPWDREERAAYAEREGALQTAFGEASARGAWYRELRPGEDPAPLWWSLLEALYG